MRALKSSLVAVLLALGGYLVSAQTPAPIVVQAATTSPGNTTSTAPAHAVTQSPSLQEATKLLEELKANNADLVKKQQDVLQKLDDLQQAAEQMRIYAKRG